MMTHTGKLVDYIEAFYYENMPSEVISRSKLILLDTLGAILAASSPEYEGTRALLEMVDILGGNPHATIIGNNVKTNCVDACLVNGTFGYAFDIEPHHVAAVLHPAAVCVPVALAFGEQQNDNGKRLLAALTLGIEVSCRVSMAVNPRDLYGRGFHPTAVACSFGAAAAAGFLLNLDRDQWLNALGLSGNQASGLLAWAKDETENSRPFNPGIAARNGGTAALLAKLGFAGPPDIFDGKYDFFSAFSNGGEVPDNLTRNKWAITELAFKRYSSCSFTHPGLDALLELMDEHGLTSQDIDSIDLQYPRAGAHMIDSNALRSHCAQYVFAIGAVTGRVLFDDILTDRRDDPEIKRLYDNSRVIPDDKLDRSYPHQYESIVTVTTTDNRKLEKYKGWAKGTAENPMSEAELLEKFYQLSTRRLPRDKADEIKTWIDEAESKDSISDLMGLLRPEE